MLNVIVDFSCPIVRHIHRYTRRKGWMSRLRQAGACTLRFDEMLRFLRAVALF